jgi:hypothetical protein
VACAGANDDGGADLGERAYGTLRASRSSHVDGAREVDGSRDDRARELRR